MSCRSLQLPRCRAGGLCHTSDHAPLTIGHFAHYPSCSGRRSPVQSLVGRSDARNVLVKAVAFPSRDEGSSASRGDHTPHAYAPARELEPPANVTLNSDYTSFDVIAAPVWEEVIRLRQSVVDFGQNQDERIEKLYSYAFQQQGKNFRPVIVLLMARAIAQYMGYPDLLDRQRELAACTEIMHTASLLHDDVTDESDQRRGKPALHKVKGTSTAVMSGDYLFARSSFRLAKLWDCQVNMNMAQVIMDFANGELSQEWRRYKIETSIEDYLTKSYLKTGSLIANSCLSVAELVKAPENIKAAVYGYGRNLGLAFQIVDDILDFTKSSEELGKPKGQDLQKGLLTAPVIFALRGPQGARLQELIETEFDSGDEERVDEAMDLVLEHGIGMARELALDHALAALGHLSFLPQTKERTSLEQLVHFVLSRDC